MGRLENYIGFKKMTVLLVPDAAGHIRQVRLSNFLLVLFVCLMVTSGFFLTWFFMEYQGARVRNERLIQAEKENREHRREFLRMAASIPQIKEEADELKSYYGEVKATLDRVAGNPAMQHAGMGGSDVGLFQATFTATGGKTERELIRHMHRSLDSLKEELDITRLTVLNVAQFLSYESMDEAEGPLPVLMGLEMHDKSSIREQLKAVAIEFGLEPNLALAMAKVESGYNPKSVSPKGAVGVLQVMPRVALQEFNVTRQLLFNPHVNIRLGLSLMKYLLKRFDQDLDLALAAYNAGPTRVINAGHSIPPIKETQDYVERVKTAMTNMH